MTIPRHRVRLLPATIVTMAVLAITKITVLSDLGFSAGSVALARAEPPAVPPVSATARPPASDPALAESGAPHPTASIGSTKADEPVSSAEKGVLLELRSRRLSLDGREQSITAREAIVAAAEKRLMARVDQLKALQESLEGLELKRKEHAAENWRGLVKTYEAMRPRDAATILNDMETPILLQVLDRMKEAKAAAVLAAMIPARARVATEQLAEMRTRSERAP